MTQSSRRVFLVLAGALLLGAIVQRTKVLSNEEASLTPKPKNPVPIPTKKKVIPSTTPSPTPSKETASPTPSTSPTDAASPQVSPTAAPEGVVIAQSEELVLRQTKVFNLKDTFGITTSYSLTRTSRGIVAFDTRCTHAGAPCVLNQSQLQCPAHGSIFDPENGEVIRGPAVEPLKSYRTLEVNGEIRIVIS
jgi:Rieske Fe-S protein